MKKALIIGQIWPEPKSSAAGSRMVQILELLKYKYYQLTFVSAAEKSAFSFDLESLDIQTENVKLNDVSFEVFLKKLNPDLVLFDRFMLEEQFGWRVREQVPEALTILDTEDLHFLRKARQEAVKKDLIWKDEMLYSVLAKREVASILRCDLSLIISEVEIKILIEKMQVPKTLLHYLPFSVKEIPTNTSSFEQRKDFLFIGNCLHEPNLDAIRVLKTEIWPRLRKKVPEARLLIFGAYMPESILQLNNEKEGFLCLDRAEGVEKVMREARVFLAPLRFGAGQKGKLLESMLYALPNVTSEIGAEGMAGNLAWNGLISSDWESFSEHAAELYTNKTVWENAVEKGFELLEQRFFEHTSAEKFLEKIEALSHTLSTHRNEHFIGQILQSNTLNAYKYMSKWIEEKNK